MDDDDEGPRATTEHPMGDAGRGELRVLPTIERGNCCHDPSDSNARSASSSTAVRKVSSNSGEA